MVNAKKDERGNIVIEIIGEPEVARSLSALTRGRAVNLSGGRRLVEFHYAAFVTVESKITITLQE